MVDFSLNYATKSDLVHKVFPVVCAFSHHRLTEVNRFLHAKGVIQVTGGEVLSFYKKAKF